MGFCKDCMYVSVQSGWFSDKYVCTNSTVKWAKEREERKYSWRGEIDEVVVVVDPNGSCNHFSAAPTSESVGYHVSHHDTGDIGGCFLTSACVEYLGKDDDCEELTILRQFRDTYLKNVTGGEDMIKEYYTIAPRIVEKINSSVLRDKYYDYIYKKIIKSIDLIKNGENEQALLEYADMVNHMKIELGIA